MRGCVGRVFVEGWIVGPLGVVCESVGRVRCDFGEGSGCLEMEMCGVLLMFALHSYVCC